MVASFAASRLPSAGIPEPTCISTGARLGVSPPSVFLFPRESTSSSRRADALPLTLRLIQQHVPQSWPRGVYKPGIDAICSYSSLLRRDRFRDFERSDLCDFSEAPRNVFENQWNGHRKVRKKPPRVTLIFDSMRPAQRANRINHATFT